MLEQQQQIVVVDPTGAWHGLRSSADGKSAGYAVVVFGGDHPDAPLDFRSGKAMAHAVVEHGFSAIFDIGNFPTEEQVQFVMDLCAELLRINRAALHIFMDEADTFAPQKPLGLLQNKCLGTVSRLVKQGGIRGLGFTMITQRPASMNKDVLSQVDILTVLRMSHPLDIKAAVDWIQSEVGVEFAADVKKALPSLPVGTAFFCSASLGFGERVAVRKRRTFNSGATPEPGQRKIEPTVLAQVDIAKLGQQIADSVKHAEANNPESLKKRIAELEAQVKKGSITMELQQHIAELEKQAQNVPRLEATVSGLQSALREIANLCQRAMLQQPIIQVRQTILQPPPVAVVPKVSAVSFTPTQAVTVSGDLPNRILRALAEFESIGRSSIPKTVLSAYAEARGGYFGNTLGKMRTDGLICYPEPGTIAMTHEGRAKAPRVSAPANAEELFERAVKQSGTGLPERIMRTLRASYPKSVSREALSESVGARGGYYGNTLGAMKSASFIEYPRPGEVRLASWTVME